LFDLVLNIHHAFVYCSVFCTFCESFVHDTLFDIQLLAVEEGLHLLLGASS
jgi:hypothetical protein